VIVFGWIWFLVWQIAPGIFLLRLRARSSMSWPAVIVSAAIAVLGTVGAYYIAFTDSSSTAPLILVVSPFYLLGAVLLVFGVDFIVRATRRRSGST
jgi:uncharacterized membrane protein HdeD (DUF308 family)